MMAYREEDLIGIPFPNHSSEVLCRLNEQRREGLLCDVVLIVQDQEYHTHRSVLAACSQYFKKLFTVATDNSHEPHAVYQIDFVGPESLTAILEFAYTSTLTVTAGNVKQILNAAQMLEIPCIINVCLEIMDGGGGEEGGGGEGGGGGGDRAYEEEEDEEEDDEEEEEDLEDDADESREEEQEEPEDDASEKSTQASEPQEMGALEQGETGERGESPPCSSQQEQGQSRAERRRCQEESSEKSREPDSLEGRALKDFSIESLLQEGLYPKMPGLERGSGYSPLLPGFYPPMWAAEFPAFPQILEPHHAPHPYGPQMENTPLDLAVKKEVIQEELKDEVASGLLHRDFLKEFMGPGLGGGVLPEAHLSQIKDEADLRSYLSFLSASHLGVFPPWQLEEERKLKPKASQQCPICNKVIQGAGKLPRHMRTHTGEKPYMCTICEVRFTR